MRFLYCGIVLNKLKEHQDTSDKQLKEITEREAIVADLKIEIAQLHQRISKGEAHLNSKEYSKKTPEYQKIAKEKLEKLITQKQQAITKRCNLSKEIEGMDK